MLYILKYSFNNKIFYILLDVEKGKKQSYIKTINGFSIKKPIVVGNKIFRDILNDADNILIFTKSFSLGEQIEIYKYISQNSNKRDLNEENIKEIVFKYSKNNINKEPSIKSDNKNEVLYENIKSYFIPCKKRHKGELINILYKYGLL